MGQQDFQNVRIGIDVTPLAGTEDADSKIGTGAYGMVRKAQYTDDSGNAHRVAVKYANDLKERRAHLSLRNELKVFDRLGPHPHIVRCFGGKLGDGDLQVDTVSDKLAGSDFYLVLELMDMNLNDLLRSREFTQHCTYRMLLNICMQITDGLDFLHSQNIIHYDLKPANVLLDEALNVKLADFGLSKVKLQRSIDASFRGQYGYMAPEVMLSLHIPGLKASDKVDIFSLGVIIWECLMKGEGTALDRLPSLSLDSSTGSSASHDLCYVGSTRYMLGRDWPESLVKLLEDCVNIQPDQRPSCRDVRDRLKLIIEDPWAKKCARDGVQEKIQSDRKQEHIVMDSAMDMHSPLGFQMAADL